MLLGMDILLPTAALLIGFLLGVLWMRGRPDVVDRAVEHASVVDGLGRLAERLDDLAHQGVSWQSQLRQQVDDVRHSTDLLRQETGSLATALRKPQVRGRWGEMHLRRAVELAGLVDRCDFSEQVRLVSADGPQRPDLVVRLAGGRCVVVDAKVPLDAFLDATGSDDADGYAAHLARHARQLRGHAEALAAKAYWRALPGTPEFVVMFVPGESFLSAALDAEPDLIEHAAARNVLLATPTTLIALLRTVAMGWSHAQLEDRAKEIQALGQELHHRLGSMGEHLDKVGRSLQTSVESFNRCVGSFETRVLVTARRFDDLGAVPQALAPPSPVDTGARRVAAGQEVDEPTVSA